MKRNVIILINLLIILTFGICQSQENDSITSRYELVYPLFNFDKFMGTFKVDTSILKYNSEIDYKILLDVYDRSKDSTKINHALVEVGRVINLHILNGVPKDKLKVAVVVHGDAVFSIFNNISYKEKYNNENPNLEFLKTLKDWGAELYVCSQNLAFYDLPKEVIYNEVEIAVSARTTITHYDQMGFTYFNMNER